MKRRAVGDANTPSRGGIRNVALFVSPATLCTKAEAIVGRKPHRRLIGDAELRRWHYPHYEDSPGFRSIARSFPR